MWLGIWEDCYQWKVESIVLKLGMMRLGSMRLWMMRLGKWEYCFDTGSDETIVVETVVFETGKMRLGSLRLWMMRLWSLRLGRWDWRLWDWNNESFVLIPGVMRLGMMWLASVKLEQWEYCFDTWSDETRVNETGGNFYLLRCGTVGRSLGTTLFVKIQSAQVRSHRGWQVDISQVEMKTVRWEWPSG